ncbi:hypothetical protein [Fuchsiella alkaliacetigena]|uniref:hypothetical protein n=1 Tax=Fuchsiella alkaliacetigena TaxID=957042 RepID=UPI00200B8BE5|nr:hypothetical protein [Fuchsiella alkaliacetigena]MCK8824503.1 hypothetical protein [Fuchsiella alkaliacetigena]
MHSKEQEEFEKKHGVDQHRFMTMWALGMSDTELAVSLDLSVEQIKEIKTELKRKQH